MGMTTSISSLPLSDGGALHPLLWNETGLDGAATLGPLLTAALDRALTEGADSALSGPVSRGDAGTVRSHVEALGALLDDEGLDALTDERERPAFLVRPRMVDVGAAVSRYRKLELAGRPGKD